MLRPILTAADLPAAGIAHEGPSLDFKQQVDPTNRSELAKDVAALANASGGSVVVGAVPDGERLLEYRPLPVDFVEKIRAAYDIAVRDLCRPKPLFDLASISKGNGVVLAVNVQPFPGQPVGVALGADAKAGFCFPLRTGSHTTYLTPDQLPMFMLPDVRRIAILLSSIPPEQRKKVLVLGVPRYENDRAHYQFASLEGLDLADVTMRNTLPLKIGQGLVSIPADSIEHIWREEPEGSWVISASILFLTDGVSGVTARPWDDVWRLRSR